MSNLILEMADGTFAISATSFNGKSYDQVLDATEAEYGRVERFLFDVSGFTDRCAAVSALAKVNAFQRAHYDEMEHAWSKDAEFYAPGF